jgi:hypothetical protein
VKMNLKEQIQNAVVGDRWQRYHLVSRVEWRGDDARHGTPKKPEVCHRSEAVTKSPKFRLEHRSRTLKGKV